jgi:hypothetical protein
MSQLQEGDEYQSEYETNFGSLTRDPKTKQWTDTENPTVRVPPPENKKPHVPRYDESLGLMDTNGALIPSFIAKLDAYSCLDQK